MGVSVKCPSCKHEFPMIPVSGEGGKFRCMMCGYVLELQVEVDKPKKTTISVKQMKDAFEKASSIVQSQLERSATVNIKLTGEWARALAAAECLMVEGLNLKKESVLVQVIKRGINATIAVFADSAMQREILSKAVEEGSLRQETVDNLLSDFDNLAVKFTKDKDFSIGGEDESSV